MRSIGCGGLEGFFVCRTDAKVMNNLAPYFTLAQLLSKQAGKEQVRKFQHLIATRGEALDFNSQGTQSLNPIPNRGAGRTDLLGDLGSGHQHRGILRQQEYQLVHPAIGNSGFHRLGSPGSTVSGAGGQPNGDMRKLMSTAAAEWVTAPTEI